MTPIEAGRELNAQIAAWMGDDFGEKPTHQWASTWDVDDDPSKDFYCRRCWDFADEQMPGPCVTEAAPYTTNIGVAWTVVEKLHLWIFPQGGRWYAGAEGSGADYVYVDPLIGVLDGHLAVLEQADTAPLAICRAALRLISQPAAECGKDEQ